MIRRSPLRLTIAIAATAAALSGCATFTDSDVVAQVEDNDITTDEFEPLADEFFANPDVFGTTPPQSGRVDGEQSRLLLSVMIRQQLVNQFLDAQGVDNTAIRQAYIDTAFAGTPIANLSPEFQALIADVDDQPRTEAMALVDTATSEQLRALYADNPASTGALCTRHILVASEAEALDVLDELASGADFATLAAERSTDPTASATGGALSGADNECVPVQIMQQQFDPAFTAAALQGTEGVASAPVESSFGWHVILHRPWDEVADSVAEMHQPGDSGNFLFDGFAATAGVEAAPRFGSWDSVAASIVPIG